MSPLNVLLNPENEGVVLVATNVPPADPDHSLYSRMSALVAVPD